MNAVSQKSSGAKPISLPPAYFGLNQNFCRNTSCSAFGVVPMIGSTTAVGGNHPVGQVMTPNGKSWLFECGVCGKRSVLRNNRAVAEDYRRLRRQRRPGPPPDS